MRLSHSFPEVSEDVALVPVSGLCHLIQWTWVPTLTESHSFLFCSTECLAYFLCPACSPTKGDLGWVYVLALVNMTITQVAGQLSCLLQWQMCLRYNYFIPFGYVSRHALLDHRVVLFNVLCLCSLVMTVAIYFSTMWHTGRGISVNSPVCVVLI